MIKSFINFSDLTFYDIDKLFKIKDNKNLLEGKNIGVLFEKYSTRTRLSFTVGINQLGGEVVELRESELNLSRSESLEDTFKAFNCYLDGLVYRTSDHNRLTTCEMYFNKPVINAMSDKSHPCQILSDIFTMKEHFGRLDLHILWMGDISNVCLSLIESLSIVLNLNLTICSTDTIIKEYISHKSVNINFESDLSNVNLSDIDVVMTDVFISMNEQNDLKKINSLKSYQVNEELMYKTKNTSVFMHCLPANLGMEVTSKVINGPKSIVWKQAKNRMIAQKKLMHLIKWD